MQRILAAIDTSIYADSVVDHAGWVAARCGGPIELLHVIPRIDSVPGRGDMSGALGLGARAGLMEELVALAEVQGRLAREQGKALLAAATARLAAQGVIDVQPVHRHGGVIETLVEREAEADLVIIGKRGEQADFARGHIGSYVERMVRESIRPVMVAARQFVQPERVVIGFDGGPSARKAVHHLAGHPLITGLEVHLVTAGAISPDLARHLDAAQAALPGAILHRETGAPDVAIEAVVKSVGAQLLVIGAYGHSPLRTLILGSTTTALMRASPVSLLLYR